MKVEFEGGVGGWGGGGAEPHGGVSTTIGRTWYRLLLPLCYLSHVLVKMEHWIVAKFTPSIVIVQNFIINQTL